MTNPNEITMTLCSLDLDSDPLEDVIAELQKRMEEYKGYTLLKIHLEPDTFDDVCYAELRGTRPMTTAEITARDNKALLAERREWERLSA
jgi:hypothetical protein